MSVQPTAPQDPGDVADAPAVTPDADPFKVPAEPSHQDYDEPDAGEPDYDVDESDEVD